MTRKQIIAYMFVVAVYLLGMGIGYRMAPTPKPTSCVELNQMMEDLWDRQDELADFYGTGPSFPSRRVQ